MFINILSVPIGAKTLGRQLPETQMHETTKLIKMVQTHFGSRPMSHSASVGRLTFTTSAPQLWTTKRQ
jgi:hypothetical protein